MTNRLTHETSPYLQQHADNPVDWYPWSPEALALARTRNKPILLSIGYSACHWCHVMAHESFEDNDTADLMNALFVNIKVDREERPDLDHIYQTAHYMLTRRNGGWPLTLFLTPDQVPFVAGTYFPKEPRQGLPDFKTVVERVAELYRTRQSDIVAQNTSLLQAMNAAFPEAEDPVPLSEAPLTAAYALLQQSFDPVEGGFGRAPKFPHATDIELLFRHAAATGATDARDMALHTLRKMSEGGIYDQIGGGFCRYSVDDRWEIPHFEKMLYDNGPLLALYADAYTCTDDVWFRRVAQDIAAWVMREMQSGQGGYYSSLDADSEHEEGKFYVWTPEQIASLLGVEEYAVVVAYYGLDFAPNFENRHWNLRIALPQTTIAKNLNLPPEHIERMLDTIRKKLFADRAHRIPPGRDEKVLVSWNALMIKGMAHAGTIFDDPSLIASAQQSADFIRTRM